MSPAHLPYLSPEHRLCYIKDGVAYFAQKDPREVRGDDWNDAPYEHNAGTPYEGARTLMYDSSEHRTPAEIAGLNSPYSVDQINMGAVAWLTSWGSWQFTE